jgi:hypothetical protein
MFDFNEHSDNKRSEPDILDAIDDFYDLFDSAKSGKITATTDATEKEPFIFYPAKPGEP